MTASTPCAHRNVIRLKRTLLQKLMYKPSINAKTANTF
ncbi:hypothetical protein JCM19237_1231 [Photobacterium aphoticum]|uniref:Plus3 domain-containing protein n=1 Tax=Photobacterium aphoticum TaxID=754436 RepID=A0A090QRX0_9GAMM|nr:hypothetical protein JCM19237_1231 [Photobacterium aphoticum]